MLLFAKDFTMKYSISAVFGFLCLVLSFNACHDDVIEEVIITDEYTPYTIYEIEIVGLISDENGNPLSDALLSFDGQSKRTNELGHFSFDNVNANSQNALLSITAEGYISAHRLITVLSSNTVNLNIILTPIPEAQTFDAAAGSEVLVSDDARITFYPDGIIRNNQSFDGDVFIKAYHLAKDDADLFQKLPGDLIGIDTEQELQILDTYGMLYVTMEDGQGNELQPDPQTKALLSIDIPEEFVSIAPSEIPLWFFDDMRGVWIEDGMAVKNGNTYEGTVSHFTWWNIDIPYSRLISVCLQAEDLSTGEALANEDILFSSDGILFGVQRTNDEGRICLNLPADVAITLQLATDCEYNSDATIGPFSANQESVRVQLGTNEAGTIRINGNVAGCNSQAIDNPIASVTRDGIRTTIDINSDGSYSYSLVCPRVGEKLSVFIYDGENEKSVIQDVTINEAQSDKNIDFEVCDEVQNIVAGNIFGQDLVLIVNAVKENPNETILILENGCYLSFLGNSTGTFEGAYFCAASEYGNITVTVDTYNSVIKGSFTGDNISGTFSANN